MATDFATEPTVVVAKVDATAENAKSTAEDQDIKSYPTIKYFPKGTVDPEMYEGGRTEQDLIDFLNEKAGTHRTVGGGLDANAGTIASLDAMIGKLGPSDSLATISEEVAEVAKGLQDKYAMYYVRVIDKLGKGQGYAEKEMARLEGLVKKGGLAPEKLYDLISLSNILMKFSRQASIKEEL